MRDRRFIAEHRGGALTRENHILLARWAADCAQGVLHLYTRGNRDRRPSEALETLRKWADGEVKTGAAMEAARSAHAAARDAKDKAAVAAARAAGQAAGTAHAADHSMGALLYVLKAREAAGLRIEDELSDWLQKLPKHLRDQVASGVYARLSKLGVGRALRAGQSGARQPA